MLFSLAKIIASASIIAFASWLSGKKPVLAGFLMALPLMTLIVLPFSYVEHQDPGKTALFAKSILVGLPLTSLFFLPFFFPGWFQNNFWLIYGVGLTLLATGYFLHQWLLTFLG